MSPPRREGDAPEPPATVDGTDGHTPGPGQDAFLFLRWLLTSVCAPGSLPSGTLERYVRDTMDAVSALVRERDEALVLGVAQQERAERAERALAEAREAVRVLETALRALPCQRRTYSPGCDCRRCAVLSSEAVRRVLDADKEADRDA